MMNAGSDTTWIALNNAMFFLLKNLRCETRDNGLGHRFYSTEDLAKRNRRDGIMMGIGRDLCVGSLRFIEMKRCKQT